MSSIVSKTACPRCRSNGRDSSGDNLSIYEDGHGYCHACGYWQKSGGEQMQATSKKSEDISRYQSYPIRAIEDRGISKEIAERYGVRAVIHAETGKPEAYMYPYTVDGRVVAYKVRELPKKFSIRGDSSNIGLFGQEIFKGGQLLIITEGEADCLAIAEMLSQNGKSYSVVSIPNGADINGTLDSKVKKQFDYFTKFDRIIIAMDNDEAGRATAIGMADWLAPYMTTKILNYPEGIKDACDLLKDKDSKEKLWKCLTEAKEYSPEGVIAGGEISFEDLLKAPPKGYTTPFSGLDDKLKGLRKGELVLFTAGSGIGKSTAAREIGYHFIKHHNLKIANIMLEEPMEKTQLGYMALDNNIPLSSLYMYPDKYDKVALQKSYDELVDNGRNYFFRHFGSMNNESLMAKMRYYANALDVDFIILDHISMVISGQNVDERKTIDMLMTDLAAFCNETGVGVIAVVHLKRKNTNGGKEKALNEGGRVSLTDLRGSGGLEQMSWSVVALERNQQDAEEANFSTIRVLKNRIWGFTGEAGRLYYDATTGRLQDAPEPEDYQEAE